MGIPKNTRSGDSQILMSAEIEKRRLKKRKEEEGKEMGFLREMFLALIFVYSDG